MTARVNMVLETTAIVDLYWLLVVWDDVEAVDVAKLFGRLLVSKLRAVVVVDNKVEQCTWKKHVMHYYV